MKQATNQLVGTVKMVAASAAVVAAFALGAVIFAGRGNVHAAMAMDDNSVEALSALDRAMEAVAARVTPAVVNVAVTARNTDEAEGQGQGGPMQGLPPGLQQFFGQNPHMQQQPQLEHGVGSGIIISPDGYIVTNNHVVDGATSIKVTLNDRRVLTGKVVGVDKLTDLAVIKVNATNLPSIAWGDSTKLQPGQTVLAFGSPFGYFQFSVTRGIVSAGFAIPSQIVRATTEQLIKNGKVEHGYLGISMNDVTPENAQFFNLQDARGAIVAQVTPDSPASRGGVETGDVITELNGSKVENGSALQVAVSEMAPGNKIALGVIRNGKPVTLNLTVGQFHGNTEVASNDSEDEPGGAKTGKLGLAVSNLTADARQQINAPEQLHGVVVESVRPASPADEAGIQPGDVIVEVNRKPAESASQFTSEVHNNQDGKAILMLVWSKGNASYRTIHPDQEQPQG